jgi:hypothetical protein
MHGASYRYQFIACVAALDRDRRDNWWSLSTTEGKLHLLLTLKTLDAFQTTFAIEPRDLQVAELVARQVGNLA